MNIVFDLDGTLLDARQRLHRLFVELAPACGLGFEDYWAHKRAKLDHAALLSGRLGWSAQQVQAFVDAWMPRIEAPEYLALDTPIEGVPQALKRLAAQATLHVCTARQQRQPVVDQLRRHGLLGLFASVLVTGPQGRKDDLLRASLRLDAGDWLLGDTGKDVQTGRALGLHTCAVLSGFLSRASLLPYEPELILDSVADFHLPPAA